MTHEAEAEVELGRSSALFHGESKTEGKTVRTRRSAPDVLSAAQSSGLWPGASATFAPFFGFAGICVVVGGGAREAPSVLPTLFPLPPARRATPGCRTASPGTGGGGMSCASVSILGTGADERARWALLSAGKAGATSDVSCSVSVSSPSSSSSLSLGSSGGGEARVNVGTAGDGARRDVPEESQLRR